MWGNGSYTYNDDRTVSIINSYFMGGSPTVFYNATGSGNATLNVIGSTFGTNLGFNRSSASLTGTFTLNVSGSTLSGGMNGSRSGATSIGGNYYTFSDNSKVTGNITIGGNNGYDHTVKGDVSVRVLSGSTVTGTIYGITSTKNYTVNGNIDIEVRDASAYTIYGACNVASGYAGAVGGNVTITLSNTTLNNVYTAGNGAVVNGGAYVKLEGNATIKYSLSASSDTVALGSHLQISGVKNVIEVAGDIASFNTLTLADGADLTLTKAGISLTASAQEGVASVITVGKNADLNVAGTVSGAIILKSGAYFKAGALAEGTVITIDETTALTDIIFVDVAAESNYTITSSKSVGKSGNLSYIYDADALYEY